MNTVLHLVIRLHRDRDLEEQALLGVFLRNDILHKIKKKVNTFYSQNLSYFVTILWLLFQLEFSITILN